MQPRSSTEVSTQSSGAAGIDSASVSGFAPLLPTHIPSLDGMRAACILMVVIAHALEASRFPVLYTFFGHLGNYGVRIFFLISGFLITTLLLNEHDRTGTISLKNFYMRRMIRIFPAFYVYVGTVFVISQFGLIELWPGDLLHSLTYTMNYHVDRGWFLNHTWSLSVEEQFYLLWPAVLLLARPRRGLWTAFLVVLVVPFIRLGMVEFFHAGPTSLGRHFEAVSDALGTGALLAGFYNRLGASAAYRRIQCAPGYIVLVPGTLLLISALTFRVSVPLYYVIGQSIANLGGVLLLDYVVRRPSSITGIILNTPPMVAIGQWSYSIYLWQELFLDVGYNLLHIRWPFNLMCVGLTSLASYYGVEKPFQRLRKYFLPRGAKLPAAAPAAAACSRKL